MKCTLFLMLAGLAFITAHADSTFDEMAISLANIFMISLKSAEICIQKMSTTANDLSTLDNVVTNRKMGPVDQKSLRRASCTLTCCAQAQGTMSGNKIDVEMIQSLMQKLNVPEEVKSKINVAVNVCNDQVKTITDDCNVGFQFIKCLANQNDYSAY